MYEVDFIVICQADDGRYFGLCVPAVSCDEAVSRVVAHAHGTPVAVCQKNDTLHPVRPEARVVYQVAAAVPWKPGQ